MNVRTNFQGTGSRTAKRQQGTIAFAYHIPTLIPGLSKQEQIN